MTMLQANVSLAPTMDLDTVERRVTGATQSITLKDNSRAYNKNIIAELDPAGKPYSVQRPGVQEYYEKPVADTRGRGIYTWIGSGVGTPSTSVIGVLGSEIVEFRGGTNLGSHMGGNNDFVFFAEVGGFLVVADDTAIVAIDSSFVVTPIVLGIGGIIKGIQSLNNILYVLHPDGTIENSAVGDPFTWNPLDFIVAERSEDRGSALLKHHDHLVVMGENSIEFFYDAGNPTGSPLARRQDISYNTGTLYTESTTEYGDIIYFLSREASGGIQLSSIENFGVKVLSDSNVNRYLTTVLTTNFDSLPTPDIGDPDAQTGVVMSSTGWGNHQFVFLTFVESGSSAFSLVVLDTLVYDKYTGLWSNFESDDSTLGPVGLPFISWTKGTAGISSSMENTLSMYKVGMLVNGRVARFRQDGIPTDTLLGEDPTFQGDPIEVVIRTLQWEADEQAPVTNRRKFLYNLEPDIKPIRPYQDLSSFISISWTDDDYQTFSTPRTVLIAPGNRRLSACGSFRQRAFEITYSGLNQVRFEDLELSLRVSSYA